MNKKLHLIGSVCIINDNKVLFLKRTPNVDSPNVWSLPGGHVENKESFFQAALREVHEETNLDIQLEGITNTVHLSRKDSEYFMFFFVSHVEDTSNLKVDGKENNEYCWLSLTKIENNKIEFRHELLKKAAIKALTQKPTSLNLLNEYFENEK